MGTDKDKKLHEELNAINVNGSQNTIGDHNFIIQSSDVHLHLKDPNHKIFFYTPSQPDIHFNDQFINKIVSNIISSRIIVLWSKECTRNERNQVARKIAYELQKKVNTDLKIREWLKNTHIFDVPVFLMDEPIGIYVITDISPYTVQYDLESLLNVVEQKTHFLILTTNTVLDIWKRFTSKENLFQKITIKNLYGENFLAKNLVELFSKSSLKLPREIRTEYMDSYRFQKEIGLEIDELILFHITKSLTIKDIATGFRGYDDLEKFIRLLPEDETHVFSDEFIKIIIKEVLSKDFDFLKWYHNTLTKRQQHLLLGVALLSGLYENQMFAALEELVENDWRTRAPVLDSFDYEDLEILRNFAVDIIETGTIERKIEIKPAIKQIIFRECWYNHQRLVINSIQGLINLVKNSTYSQPPLFETVTFKVTDEYIDKLYQLSLPEYVLVNIEKLKGKLYTDWKELISDIYDAIGSQSFKLYKDKIDVIFDKSKVLFRDTDFREISKSSKKSQLYGNFVKVNLIYDVVGSALRLIAYESLSLAEEALFFYARQPNLKMRDLAALSLSQWKKHEEESTVDKRYEQELIRILKRWYKNPKSIYDPFGGLLSKEMSNIIDKNKEYIYSTIVITIGYAAVYDTPDNCSEELLELLKEFVPPLWDEEFVLPEWETVDESLGSHTVPLMMKYHLEQLHHDGLLYRLMIYRDSAKAISRELSLAYLNKPNLFNEIIKQIYDICKQLKTAENTYKKKNKKPKNIVLSDTEIVLIKGFRHYDRRNSMISILIAVYGNLQFTQGEGRLTAQETFDRLSDIYRYEGKNPKLVKAILDAVKSQITRDFHNIISEVKTILRIFELVEVVEIIPGIFPHIQKERKKYVELLIKEKKSILEEEPDAELDEEYFDTDRHISKTESIMFNWILKERSPYKKIGFLTLLGAYLNKTSEKIDVVEEFIETIRKKSWWGLFTALLISPINLLFLGSPAIMFQLLPTVILLNSRFGQEISEMINVWFTKINDLSIRRFALSLKISLVLSDYFILVIVLYFFIIYLIIGLLPYQ